MFTKIEQRATSNEPNYVSNLPITRLIINGQVLEYYDDKYFVNGVNSIEEADARELFFKTKELFDKAGIKFALIYGSLLGAVREKGLIKGDQDMDICICDEEQLRSNLISFQDSGLKLCRVSPGKSYTFQINPRGYIDVYIMRDLQGLRKLLWGKNCLSMCGCVTPRKFFQGWDKIEFLGKECLCPANPEKFLEWCYGSDWKIPRNSKGRYEVKTARFYTILTEFPVRIIRFIFNKKYRETVLKWRKASGRFPFNIMPFKS